ncbi:phosphopantetheine-binding protein [Saccharopolyspora phatthalungensis]|uniref:Acyl carrier protein n=1 Tax=Saccharopolyspora phatthalungensis TaxID=664693 RepID=A0A840QBH5_9PSEU|nr:phosphopantetheine-binding protein [Saccharopolyspora phatthalungensis]MBB5155998.1 acyl carrier protein [Saccharopolyspora phatthalungensis]
MPQPTTPQHARGLVRDALLKAMPGADLDELDDHEDFRDALELDSLDFLTFVETLGNASGIRIDEEDYDKLTTMDSAVDFLTSWS